MFSTKLTQKVYFHSKTVKVNTTIELCIFEGLGTKLQLKTTILSFWKKFAQKRYFQSKT